jgi:hypothetical protein
VESTVVVVDGLCVVGLLTTKYLLVVVDGLCVVGLLINGVKWDGVVAIVVFGWLVVAPWGLKIDETFYIWIFIQTFI